MNTTDMTKTLKSTLATLDIQRKSLEMEAEAITSELTTPPSPDVPPMGIDTPLVDREGYPRGDVDVYRARELRHRLACIRTDHSALMKNIEGELLKLSALLNQTQNLKNGQNSKNNEDNAEAEELAKRAAPKPKPKFDPVSGKWVVMNWDGSVAGAPNGEARNFHDLEGRQKKAHETEFQKLSDATENLTVSAMDNDGNTTMQGQQDADEHPSIPFAVIDGVDAESPAEAAGLHKGDLICAFGSANYENHRQLRAIAEMVPQAAAGSQAIPIAVLRRKKMSVEDDVAHSVEAGEHVTVRLKIYPRPWKGRGLIGCHIVPYDPAAYEEPHY